MSDTAVGPEGINLPPEPVREAPPHTAHTANVTLAAAQSTLLNSRLAPQDLDAERSVLGGVLLTNNALFDVMETLQQADFYREPHRKIFQGMVDLSLRNEPIDVLTLADELRRKGHLEDVGGVTYIGSLDAFVPATANLMRYAKIVRDAAHDRRRIEAAHAIAREGYERLGTVEDRDSSAERQILDATQGVAAGDGLVPVGQTLAVVYASIESIADRGTAVTGLRSNLPRMDRMTSGWHQGQLIYILGQAGSGKTSLLMDLLIVSSIDEGLPTASFCMEMSREEMVSRLVASVGGVDHHRMRTGKLKPYEWQSLAKAADKIHRAPLHIDDTPALTITSLRARCIRMRAKLGALGAIGVDYVGLMTGSGEGNREQEISTISRGLKSLAREMKAPVFALLQMNRSVVKREDKRPSLADGRDSGSVEQDCDIMLGVFRPAMHFPAADKEDAEVLILKQRQGPTGTIRARFRREFFRFEAPPPEPGDQEEMAQ